MRPNRTNLVTHLHNTVEAPGSVPVNDDQTLPTSTPWGRVRQRNHQDGAAPRPLHPECPPCCALPSQSSCRKSPTAPAALDTAARGKTARDRRRPYGTNRHLTSDASCITRVTPGGHLPQPEPAQARRRSPRLKLAAPAMLKTTETTATHL